MKLIKPKEITYKKSYTIHDGQRCYWLHFCSDGRITRSIFYGWGKGIFKKMDKEIEQVKKLCKKNDIIFKTI